ncbi:hypothetical protein Neosp_007873 [[Neocosmospora] mangrovei]
MQLLRTLNSFLELLKQERESEQAGSLSVAYAMAFSAKTVLLNMYACTETNRRLNSAEETEMQALALAAWYLNESGSEDMARSLDILNGCLRTIQSRWRVANDYLILVESQRNPETATDPDKMTSSGKLILVTGANGFIATHTITTLLRQGYAVRGAVRSQTSADAVLKTFSDYSNKLSVVVVPDMTISGAFDEAVQGVDGVLHMASPFSLNIKDNETEMLVPAIKGTESVLESVAAHGVNVKRVVLTSSFAAMVDLTKGFWPGHTYDENDWNDVTYDYAKAADGATAYVASKALAEKAAWNFMKERKPGFELTVLCPPMVFGPPVHAVSFSALNVTTWDMNRFISGELEDVPDTSFWGFVDVRDLAQAHLRALEIPEAGNERFFIVGGRYSYQRTADVLRSSPRIPETYKSKIPIGQPGQNYPGPNIYEVDNSKSKRILGIEYRPFEECVVDSAVKLIELRETAST